MRMVVMSELREETKLSSQLRSRDGLQKSLSQFGRGI